MAENPKKVCEIHTKTAPIDGFHHGECFSELKPCCVPFRQWFNETGNSKPTSFSVSSGKIRNGFYLEISSNQHGLFLTNKRKFGMWKINLIHFCPFCGAKVKIKHTEVLRSNS